MLVSYLSSVKNILVPEKCPYMFAVCITSAKVTMNQMETTSLRLTFGLHQADITTMDIHVPRHE